MGTVDEIKQRLDIVDTVSSYVNLEKSGRNFKGLCPFHEEKTPSFFVFPDRQTWKCFGCGAGGDLLSLVMKKEGVDFSEALRILADKAGVSLDRNKEVAEVKLTDRLHQVNEAAAQYYHNFLLHEAAAEVARAYVDKRDLDPKTVADFQLGFSPGEGLRGHLLGQGFRENELLAVGLLGKKENRIYDLFRRRLMFPIRDVKGNVLGFGARALDDSMPKYLNSPQTAIFDKSGTLYGIDRAREAIREKGFAIIVEGYMDVITAHQHSIANVVASMGTALTEKQIKGLKGLTKSLSFALDPDVAGNTATMRGIEIARRSLDREQLGMPTWMGTTSKLRAEIKLISLPEGKDPDALIREDPQLWQQLVDQALPLIDHLIAVVTSKLDLTRPEGKSSAIEQVLPLIAELEDDVEREFYLGKLASLLGVSEKVLVGMAARLYRTPREKRARATSKPPSTSYSGDRIEEYCLSLLLQHPELKSQAKVLMPEHFEHSENREVYVAWRDASSSDELSLMVDNDLQEHFKMLYERLLPPAEYAEWEKALADCVHRLEERRLRLQEEFFTSEGVSILSAGEDIDSARLAVIQQKTTEVDAQLTKGMQERTELSFFKREG